MTTLDDLYVCYCRRRECKPNSSLSQFLQDEFERNGQKRFLESVDLSKNYVGVKGVIPVFDLVKNVKTVKRLNVSNNMLEHEQLEHLVYCLALHPSIEDVDISNNFLHESSVALILQLLEANKNITKFVAVGNDFTTSSFALINEQLEKNKICKNEQTEDFSSPGSGRYYRAQVQGSMDKATSGGYTHFSTWWKNPQYIMRTSRKARVHIVMDVMDTKDSRQAGFIVFHSDGMRKVVETGDNFVVAESNVDHHHCYITMSADEQHVYSIMPYAFYPGRPMLFTITAELCHENTTEKEGWITLELIDPALDWTINILNGEWTTASAGGFTSPHTWCRNPMIQLQYSGSTHAYRMVSPANLLVTLTKSVDPEDNDDRYIGFDVVIPDTKRSDLPPLRRDDTSSKCTCPHKHSTTVSASFTIPCAALNLFIIPSTLKAGELGSYTVTIFSSVALNVRASSFPHGWNYRAVHGVWDEDNCGGSREKSMSWKCNPSVALNFIQNESPPDVSFFLEGYKSSSTGDKPPLSEDACVQDSLESQSEQERIEFQNFLRQHQANCIEGFVSVVEAISPFYRALYSSCYSEGAPVHLEVPCISEDFYVLLSTRHAGQLGKFILHIFSSRPFVVDGVESLASRERQWQLQQYAHESDMRKRRKAQTLTGQAIILTNGEEMITRNEILRKCMTTGEKYIDRDFPRGVSSLWLDPETKVVPDFPRQVIWHRPTDVNENVVFLQDWKCDCPFPYSRREWFASVVHAIAAKPEWLRIVAVGYDIVSGIVQFRFFKNGKWVVVTTDDYLPFDNTTELCMGRPASNSSDFFFPLIEKAYAKLHRCYEAIEQKVTPELSTLEVICHGLMDLSGNPAVIYSLNQTNKATREKQEEIWEKIKRSIEPNVLLSLIFHSGGHVSSKKCTSTILTDHLYPVLDARFIEGQRLVKVRHWGQPSEVNWSGKWYSGSKRWTSNLREFLEFSEEDNETFWLSFDEVLFFFTDLIMTKGTENNSWVSGDFFNSPNVCGGSLKGVSQFSLQLGEFPPDVKQLPIFLGLHQPDSRCMVLRHKGALATYRTAMGLAVAETVDNTVWLKDEPESNMTTLVVPCKSRETFVPLTVDLDNVSGKKKMTLIVFRENEKAPNMPFLLSAWSENCLIELLPVERDNKTILCDTWPENHPIGPPSSFFWRNCPHYFIFPSESTDVSFCLHQEVPIGNLPKRIGFTVHVAKECRRYLEYDPDSVILSVQTKEASSLGGTVHLLGMKERRGMPYIVVPFCIDAVPGAGFHLEAIANRSLKFCKIDPAIDWHCEMRRASFSLSDGSVGGSPRFSSWRSSPQFAITYPLGGNGRLFIALSNNNMNDTRTEIGMTLLRGDNQWEQGRRRKLVIAPEDVIAHSEEKIGAVTLDCSVDVQPGCSLILVVYASMPYLEADVSFSLFSAAVVEVESVREWKQVSMVEGHWELGYSAGGGADGFSSWINNPFMALNTFRRTQIVALLLQYPRGPEKPLVKRIRKKKAFLPPIIINPQNRMEIALDLNEQNNELTVITTTRYTRNSEVELMAQLPPAESLPFVLIPHTKMSEENGDFKLFVYSDALIDLYPLENRRIPYV